MIRGMRVYYCIDFVTVFSFREDQSDFEYLATNHGVSIWVCVTIVG